MSNVRRFQLDELTIRPGTYFNPQTEVLLVVDDSPEVDHELFNSDDFDGAEWVLISEDSPLDEHKRDELVDLFQVTYQPGGALPRKATATTTSRRTSWTSWMWTSWRSTPSSPASTVGLHQAKPAWRNSHARGSVS